MVVPIKTADRTLAGRLRTYDVVDAAIVTHGGQAAERLRERMRGLERGNQTLFTHGQRERLHHLVIVDCFEPRAPGCVGNAPHTSPSRPRISDCPAGPGR